MLTDKNDARLTTFAELYEKTLKRVSEGQIVKGKVIAIRGREVIIDIG